MNNSTQILFAIGALVALTLVGVNGVLANGVDTHAPGEMEMHDQMMQTTDRSGQLPAAILGFVIGVVVGVVAVKFFFTKSA